MARRRVDALACLGDIVGYGAQPRECLDIIMELPGAVIRGNHDEAAASEDPLEEFSEHARNSLFWTRAQLNETQRQWLLKRPLVSEYKGVTLVHACLFNPEFWPYMTNLRLASVHMMMQTTTLSFFGHSHTPMIFRRKHMLRMNFPEPEQELSPGTSYAINVGSVGQPRDGDPRACYLIYDTEIGKCGSVCFHRVHYDIEAAQQAIREAELPPFLSERLAIGE